MSSSMANSHTSLTQDKVFHLFLNLSFLILLTFYSVVNLKFYLPVFRRSATSITNGWLMQSHVVTSESCNELYEVKCKYLSSEADCQPEGYINYLYLFYCICDNHPLVGYVLLTLWSIVLFYLLANTAAKYFCSNLEGLSALLKLSPTIAGVTLLSLGNGAPDVFSSIVSFMGSGSNVVGLNSVLGGAFFVSCVVVGTISICASPRTKSIPICKFNFQRDLCFFLFVLCALLVIIFIGEINIWGAMVFTSLYFIYVSLVAAGELFNWDQKQGQCSLLPTDQNSLTSSLLNTREVHHNRHHQKLPVVITEIPPGSKSKSITEIPSSSNLKSNMRSSPVLHYIKHIMCFLELPLYLPRRLTIPVSSKDSWSKPYAVTSVTLAPMLLAILWNSKNHDIDYKESLVIYFFGALIGIMLGIIVFLKTNRDEPPTKLQFAWLAAGFMMSVTWTYITAQELVSLLISLGAMLDISPSILGLTVLAWGNSLGDLISNLAVVLNGGPDGLQVAMSGCYGGPIFSTLVGLGFSLVVSSWNKYPNNIVIPKDPSVYQTLGFLIGGILWALVLLPRRGMKLDRVLGSGLLSIYLCFLSLRVAQLFGLLQMQ